MTVNDTCRIERDLTFLPSGRTPTLDLYVPHGDGNARGRPAVLFIHGGNFCRDDKASERSVEFCTALAAAGFVVASPNYVLSKSETGDARWSAWPRNLLDCRAALAFLGARTTELGVDPERIGAVGVSAGGTLALVIAFATEPEIARLAATNDGLHEAHSAPRLSAVVNIYGRADFVSLTRPEKRPSSDEVARLASPITYALPGRNHPPVLTIHGTADDVVPFAQVDLLDRVLARAGAEHEILAIADARHAFATHVNGYKIDESIAEFLTEKLR